VAASPRVEQLLAVLDEHPGSTLRELAEATGLPARHLAMLLWRLEDDRRVVHEAHRWFRSP
jgi:DNA-binding IclR family transcriptional regulator